MKQVAFGRYLQVESLFPPPSALERLCEPARRPRGLAFVTHGYMSPCGMQTDDELIVIFAVLQTDDELIIGLAVGMLGSLCS
eukprot:421556-Rhodomonas_salina.2